MEEIVNLVISDEKIAEAAQSYENCKGKGDEKEMTAKFQYAYALLSSAHTQDVLHGINLMENLYYQGTQNTRRDYLYYISLGQTKLKKYDLALDCIEHFIQMEPNNRQAQDLRAYIKKKLVTDGLLGMAISGGAALAVGGLIGLAISMAKK